MRKTIVRTRLEFITFIELAQRPLAKVCVKGGDDTIVAVRGLYDVEKDDIRLDLETRRRLANSGSSWQRRAILSLGKSGPGKLFNGRAEHLIQPRALQLGLLWGRSSSECWEF
jgi:hypothetical protein